MKCMDAFLFPEKYALHLVFVDWNRFFFLKKEENSIIAYNAFLFFFLKKPNDMLYTSCFVEL